MDDTTQCQDGSAKVSSSCDGRCCAVFPLSRRPITFLTPPVSQSYDAVFIADMLIPLTRYEAEQRFLELGYGKLMEFAQDLYTCRHWDTHTRLCTVYDQRPWLCKNYPYLGDCDHKPEGCNYRQGIAYYVQCAQREWDYLGPK